MKLVPGTRTVKASGISVPAPVTMAHGPKRCTSSPSTALQPRSPPPSLPACLRLPVHLATHPPVYTPCPPPSAPFALPPSHGSGSARRPRRPPGCPLAGLATHTCVELSLTASLSLCVWPLPALPTPLPPEGASVSSVPLTGPAPDQWQGQLGGAHSGLCLGGAATNFNNSLRKKTILSCFPLLGGRNACVHTCVHAHVIQSIECQKAVTRASPGPISSSPTCRLLAARALCLLRHPDFGDAPTCQPQSPGTCQ